MALKIKVSNNEFVYESHLDEMARVGISDGLIVLVWTDDPGYIPHVHVIDASTKGKRLNTCVRLDKSAYFKHGSHTDTLNSAQRKEFDDFMNSKPKNGRFGSNYEYACVLWNDNNSSVELELPLDDNGNVVVPNYRDISET